ncbi:DUF4328 domain-containing protein [Hasllibacter sp. MH4015]|uniref:DUF4328 domain-containing protein n=1 Tax=Hasllibacter sp. MH4015 TaxID=2854029 RepID=UPI001CD30BE9|nr:DUF4328 domain-containing protein [Hasllibacter sp. MH4015]
MAALPYDLNKTARIDGIGVIVAAGFLVVLLATYIASGMWIYRAAANAQAVDPDPDRIKPGWAVGWFFVPIANLWMPYKSYGQTWASLHNGASLPSWAIVWWLCWIAGNYTAWIATRLNFSADTIDGFRTASTPDIVSSLVSIPAALMFRKLIFDVTQASAQAQMPATPPPLNSKEGHP